MSADTSARFKAATTTCIVMIAMWFCALQTGAMSDASRDLGLGEACRSSLSPDHASLALAVAESREAEYAKAVQVYGRLVAWRATFGWRGNYFPQPRVMRSPPDFEFYDRTRSSLDSIRASLREVALQDLAAALPDIALQLKSALTTQVALASPETDEPTPPTTAQQALIASVTERIETLVSQAILERFFVQLGLGDDVSSAVMTRFETHRAEVDEIRALSARNRDDASPIRLIDPDAQRRLILSETAFCGAVLEALPDDASKAAWTALVRKARREWLIPSVGIRARNNRDHLYLPDVIADAAIASSLIEGLAGDVLEQYEVDLDRAFDEFRVRYPELQRQMFARAGSGDVVSDSLQRRILAVVSGPANLYARYRDLLVPALPEKESLRLRAAADRAEFPEFHIVDPVTLTIEHLHDAGVNGDRMAMAEQIAAAFQREKERITAQLRLLSRARESGGDNSDEFEKAWTEYYSSTTWACTSIRDLFDQSELKELPAAARLCLIVW